MSTPAVPVARGGGRPFRGYYLADGTRGPASTTITGRFSDKDNLVRAANNLGLEGKSIQDEWYGKGSGADIGTVVHGMVEAYLHGEDVGKPETLEALTGFESFLDWWESAGFTIEVTELPIVSETHRFGGTLDALMRDSKGRPCIGDWKTSNGIWPNHLWQLASYGILAEEYLGEPLTGGYHLVRFSKEHGDFEHRHFPELNDARRLFLMFREAYDLDKLVAKRAR